MTSLIVRKRLPAAPERVFEAWTRPEQIRRWFSPGKGVECCGAEVDLRVGGRWRIDNRFPDGSVVTIAGEFESIEPPHRLVYTWRIGPATVSERVTVRFEPRPDGTEVVVVHEGLTDPKSSERHEQGWVSCMSGLGAFLQ
ncbi:MAG: SRPBCC domain-containing protein [Myxococcales bacterium]|nr:SRPBCC domain-containing protein [Myxococcales bacterium]